MFISIIIPVYNAEKYIAECLDSCLEQDIAHNDYEIICVNDGSKDGSLSILRDYESKYSNIIVIDRPNGGVCAARNTGLSRAAGDYVWFVDADDLVAPNVLGMFNNIITDCNCDRLCFGVYEFADKLTERETTDRASNKTVANASYYDYTVWNFVIRRAYLSENSIYFKHPQLKYGEDSVFCFELGILPLTVNKIDIVCYYYRRSTTSVTRQIDPIAHARSLIEATKIYKYYYDNGMSSRKNAANRMMQLVWLCRYEAIISSKTTANEINEMLRENGLLPIKRPKECTTNASNASSTEGKLFNFLFINLHRQIGYTGIRIHLRMREYVIKLRSIFRRHT